MLQYLIILLQDNSVSYCHYENKLDSQNLISFQKLKEGILFAMKHNLRIQFVYPPNNLPAEYLGLINSVYHTDVKGVSHGSSDVYVINGFEDIPEVIKRQPYVFRVCKRDLFSHYQDLSNLVTESEKLSIAITDVETFNDNDLEKYKVILNNFFIPIMISSYIHGGKPQLNVLSDRIFLESMNNCNAGSTNITLAPDGQFYICPAFYYAGMESLGDVNQVDIEIPNKYLYSLKHAPLCRKCDAYQCKRCIWLNERMTLEVNTPSREQCTVAHIERNASRKLLLELQNYFPFLLEKCINEIDYIDPFEIKES